MSIIAALSLRGKTAIGSNTGYTLAHDSVIDHGLSQWVLFGEWGVGFTGAMLALNVCRSSLKALGDQPTTATDIVLEIGKTLSDYDIGAKNPGEATWSYGIWCIIAHRSGKIWDLDESLSLGVIPEGKFWARGSGEKYALGAAHAVMSGDASACCETIVKRSVESAIYNDLYCPGSSYVRTI